MAEIDFEADIVSGIEKLIPAGVRGRNSVSSMSADEAWHAYANWTSRLVAPMPRTVRVSRELESALPGLPDAIAVRTVLDEIANGIDLQPRLSKRILSFHDAKRSRAPINQRSDLDLMLNDWGVHHLHLGAHRPGEDFTERSANLLFVSFIGSNAYAITVMPHNDWSNEQVLQVIAENWPGEEGVIYASKGIVGLAETVAPGDRKALRNAGVSVLYEHNGTVFMPRGGLTTGGTSMLLGSKAAAELNYIRQVERLLSEAPERLDAYLRVATGTPVAKTEWHLDVVDDMWAIHERISDCAVLLQSIEQFLRNHPPGHSCDVCGRFDPLVGAHLRT